MHCIFCDILTGKLEATFVYRDDQVAAFMDIQPVNPGHVLVVPVQHFVGLADLPADIGSKIFTVAQNVSAALRKSGLRSDGVNLLFADGKAAMQEVFHAHLHVIPRFTGDGFGLRFSESYKHRPPRKALEEAAAKIRASLEA
jgi:histidine triad (HIT) family protein